LELYLYFGSEIIGFLPANTNLKFYREAYMDIYVGPIWHSWIGIGI